MILDINAWLGTWPFRSLRDNTPKTLVARLDRSGITMAAVSFIEAAFHRHPQSANERLAKAVAPHLDRLIPLGTINPISPHWQDDLSACQ
ncbi:MAG: metal-dependent hydrolase, partial [bacterium]|nr:metal-dependent hydrolase [bacterium]